MTLPATFDTVPVTGRYLSFTGSPIAGRVVFTPKGPVAAEGAWVIPTSITGVLDNSGALHVKLPATDDPDSTPNGWTYTVKEDFLGGRTYDIDVPVSALPSGIDLTDYAPAPAFGGGPIVGPTLVAFASLAAQVAGLAAGGGGTGVTDHQLLTNRNSADAHPLTSITGLSSGLAAKSDTTHTHDLSAYSTTTAANAAYYPRATADATFYSKTATDTLLNAKLGTAHATSSDHDSRYFTETEITTNYYTKTQTDAAIAARGMPLVVDSLAAVPGGTPADTVIVVR